MKKLFFVILISPFIYSCNAQRETTKNDMYSSNILLLKVEKNVRVLQKALIQNDDYILIKDRRWSDIPRPTKISFIKDRDTMNYVINYENTGNYYFHNIRFKKGNYNVEILKNNLESSGKVNAFNETTILTQLFNNTTRKREDTRLNDVLFYSVDFEKSNSVKIEEKKNVVSR
ncbi:hypothetical protein EG347_02965 [Chryseobacterium sp. G0186]|uniref:hypothetical protein n=1 Tax=Chryseobacterium sp. G0186 TaxID=2487064 RepID=UPI000F505478|nr:hypothetical protein [Chryseobacterium sp. G0186]AZA76558.1 hypothetical protein EG347_02965 [Chryseobacterium sp. G0186]